MLETIDSSEGAAPLQSLIEELATALLVDEVPQDFAAELARLRELAQAKGYTGTAQFAAELAGKISGPATANQPRDYWSGEIARLQRKLEEEMRRPPASSASQANGGSQPAGGDNALAEDLELVNEFVVESQEYLSAIERQMLDLEQNPENTEAVHAVFRAFHTIKGLAGFFDLSHIQEVAHEVETLLNLVRNGELEITPPLVDVVLESADFLRRAIDAAELALSGKSAPEVADHRQLVGLIRGLAVIDVPAALPAPATPPVKAAPEPVSVAPAPPVPAPPAIPAAKPAASVSVASEPEADTQVLAAAVVPPAASPDAAADPSRAVAKTKEADAYSVRVETAKLDYLMDMVGEMVIAQSLIRHNRALGSVQDPRLQGDLLQLSRITAEVQRTTMGMRMIPVGQLFQRSARFIRDLSRKAGKAVELETTGKETEVDKTIAEELSDPLMHMIRNAIDHGIETPDERKAAGKEPVAKIRLSAYHQGGQIVIEVSDDGRGLNREKILKKARSQGIIGENAQLSDSDVHHLIFEPGFTTADKVTDISGRGVGMDVVRRHIQKLRGRIEIQTKAGQGTTFFLKLPLTLAIIEGLVVVVGAHRYIVPIFAVREMFRPTEGSISTVEGRFEMALVRGQLFPLVRLYKSFDVEPRTENPYEGLLIVAECEGRQFCVLVDDLVGKQEVVIKSLGEGMKNIPGVAGGAILGDGRVGLILDMEGVFSGEACE